MRLLTGKGDWEKRAAAFCKVAVAAEVGVVSVPVSVLAPVMFLTAPEPPTPLPLKITFSATVELPETPREAPAATVVAADVAPRALLLPAMSVPALTAML